jgi:hypothetical protein
VSRELRSPENPSLMVMHMGACPVRKSYPVNRKIAFEYEEEYETYSGYIHDCPHPFKVSLNILRFHQILRPNESFHTSLLFSPIHLIPCY